VRAFESNVRSVRSVDPKTVRIVLRSRLAGWQGLFGGILPWHALRGEDLTKVWLDRIDDPRTGEPIGTGPYLVRRWDRGRQLTLVPNPNYWHGRPAHLSQLVVRFDVDPSTVAEALRAGEIDIAITFPSAFADGVRAAGVEVVSTPSTAWEHLELRLGPGGSPLLRSKLVRRAIAYAVDRVEIVRQLVRESGLAFRVLHSTVFLTQSRSYRPNWSRYGYRPARAQRLLEQAGCRRGSDRIYSCDGVRLSLRFFTHVGPGSFRPRVLELAGRQLRRAGIEVQPRFAPQAVVFGPGGVYERGEFDVALFAWVTASPSPSGTDIFGCRGVQNLTGYCQVSVSRDLHRADRIFDAVRQAQLLNRIDARIAKDVPYLPLFQLAIWAGLASDVRGFALHGHDVLQGAENWRGER
jgi:peptide/nickel transport system substrate-binding protein